MERITASEFARRIGVTEAAVRRAIKDGRISAWQDYRGRPRIDPETAAREWVENSRFRIESAGVYDLQNAIDSTFIPGLDMPHFSFEAPALNNTD